MYRINTSNKDKFREFHELFTKQGHELIATHFDLKEIDADPLTVVTHKASQVDEGVLVEDTTMDIENEQIGIHIKWFVEHLQNFVGRKAHWVVLLAYRDKENVYIFKGDVKGTIVPPRGKSTFGFDSIFEPEGALFTLAERKPDFLNARALAVKAFLSNQPYAIKKVITSWQGPWQEERMKDEQ